MTSYLTSANLSDLADHAAADWSAEEIQTAAETVRRLHSPDRRPRTRTKLWGLMPRLRRNRAVCMYCGDVYPCITHRYATQLSSAGRIATSNRPQP